jgi:hypothetical protein
MWIEWAFLMSTSLSGSTERVYCPQPGCQLVPTGENLAHHPSLTPDIVCVSFGRQAARLPGVPASSSMVELAQIFLFGHGQAEI